MVVVKNPDKYVFVRCEKSHLKCSKYNAVLQNTDNDLIKKIPFGSSSQEHYKDTTGLGVWSHTIMTKNDDYIKHDTKRQRKINLAVLGWFSMRYLWK